MKHLGLVVRSSVIMHPGMPLCCAMTGHLLIKNPAALEPPSDAYLNPCLEKDFESGYENWIVVNVRL